MRGRVCGWRGLSLIVLILVFSLLFSILYVTISSAEDSNVEVDTEVLEAIANGETPSVIIELNEPHEIDNLEDNAIQVSDKKEVKEEKLNKRKDIVRGQQDKVLSKLDQTKNLRVSNGDNVENKKSSKFILKKRYSILNLL